MKNTNMDILNLVNRVIINREVNEIVKEFNHPTVEKEDSIEMSLIDALFASLLEDQEIMEHLNEMFIEDNREVIQRDMSHAMLITKVYCIDNDYDEAYDILDEYQDDVCIELIEERLHELLGLLEEKGYKDVADKLMDTYREL